MYHDDHDGGKKVVGYRSLRKALRKMSVRWMGGMIGSDEEGNVINHSLVVHNEGIECERVCIHVHGSRRTQGKDGGGFGDT